MKDRVLLQGTIIKVCHHENEESGTKWDDFTYEFEYNGLHFKDSSKSIEGVLADGALEVGMLIDIWFYPGTQKWKIKYKRYIIKDRDEEGNKVSTSIFVWLAAGISVLGMCIGAALENLAVIMSTMGIGFAVFGVCTLAKELKFFTDRNNGKYKILNASVVDFKRRKKGNSNGYSMVYKNVYEYIEDGEVKRYISSGERKQIGYEIFIYKNMLTGEIKKGTEWKEAIICFIVFGGAGILLIYLAFLIQYNKM